MKDTNTNIFGTNTNAKQMRNVVLVVKGKVVEGDKRDPRRAHSPRLR